VNDDRAAIPILMDEEMMDLMRRDDNPLSSAWRVFRVEVARIYQAMNRTGRNAPGIVQIKRMEMEAVMKIMVAAGVGIRTEDQWTAHDRERVAAMEKGKEDGE
jgi:hypothetical protein